MSDDGIARYPLARVRIRGEIFFCENFEKPPLQLPKTGLFHVQYYNRAGAKISHETFKDDIYISIMNQYTPLKQVEKYPEINRKVTDKEYDEVVDYAIELGVVNGFIQEGETASESFIPEFDCEGV